MEGEGGVIADLPTPDAGFALRPGPNGLTLITPTQTKHDWLDSERWFRSMVVNGLGEVVSVGFPKFFNWGEGPGAADTARVVSAISGGEPVWYSEKLDGSLIIRSVVDGRVVLRTRGTLDGGVHGATARRLAEREHPNLLDPALWTEVSMLFELTSPEHRIVIAHDFDALTLLGVVRHRDLTLSTPEHTQYVAGALGFPLPPSWALGSDPDEIIATVRSWEGREGIVLRLNDGTMVKLKSEHYLTLHALAFSLTPRRVVEICAEEDIGTLRGWRNLLAKQGLDWETETATEPVVEAWIEARGQADRDLDLARRMTNAHSHLEQKDFALAVLPYGHVAHACFAMRSGKQHQAEDLATKWAIENAIAATSTKEPTVSADPTDLRHRASA